MCCLNKKIVEYIFNGLIVFLALLGVMFIVNSSVKCDIIIETEYPFCNNQSNMTIPDADFYTIKYIRNLYGVEGQMKWSLYSCTLGKPYLFLLKDIRREKYPYYTEVFK